jgi:hypothetical protein
MEREGIVPERPTVIGVSIVKSSDVDIGTITYLHLTVALAFVTIIKYMRYIDMIGPAQFGMPFGSGGNKRVYAAFFGYGVAVEEAYFISVHGVPFGCPIRVIINLKTGVLGGFGKQYRTDIGFVTYKKMIAAVRTQFYPQVIRGKA